jgi:hypothetical protein
MTETESAVAHPAATAAGGAGTGAKAPTLVSALCFVSGIGYYELYLNGQKVGIRLGR